MLLPDLLHRLLEKPDEAPALSRIRLGLSTREDLEARGSGEVRKPETLTARTQELVPEGLFCEAIFGERAVGGAEDRVGLEERIAATPRRSRFGRVTLARPIVHPWLLHRVPELLQGLTELSVESIEKVAYGECSVVVEPGAGLGLGELLSDDDDPPPDTRVETGALGLRALIERRGGSSPMILDAISVLPPDLRPIAAAAEDSASDLNDLYRRLINRNNRLARLIELHAPGIIIVNEMRMLQEAADALFSNDREGKILVGAQGRECRSLTHLLDAVVGERGRWGALRELDGLVAARGAGALRGELPGWLFVALRVLQALAVEVAPVAEESTRFAALPYSP